MLRLEQLTFFGTPPNTGPETSTILHVVALSTLKLTVVIPPEELSEEGSLLGCERKSEWRL
jgi:hypothetical protein